MAKTKPSKKINTKENKFFSTIFNFAKVSNRRAAEDPSKFIYVILLVAGSITIWAAKSIGVPHNYVTVMAALTIIGYGIYAPFRQRSNLLRIDRIGDNCYYLGLTYTLASLIAALSSLGSADGNIEQELITNFGTALISTAIGIIMRLILMQFRTELDDAEVEARQRIIDTSTDFRDQLHEVIAMFEIYHTARIDSISKMETAEREWVESRNKRLVNTLDKQINNTEDLFQRFQSRFELLESYLTNLEESTSMVSNKISSIDIKPNIIEESFDRFAIRLDGISQNLLLSSDSLQKNTQAANDFNQLADQLTGNLLSVNEAIKQIEKNTQLQSETTIGGKKISEEHLKAMEQYRLSVETESKKIRKATEGLYKSFSRLAQTVVKEVNRG